MTRTPASPPLAAEEKPAVAETCAGGMGCNHPWLKINYKKEWLIRRK
jgi:hypothetical protein